MLNDDLKSALVDRDFDRATLLILEWGTSVKDTLNAAKGELELRRVFDAAQTFARESLCLASVVRAHIAGELEANKGSFLYRDADLERPRWRVSA
jgi:hypothetical protein